MCVEFNKWIESPLEHINVEGRDLFQTFGWISKLWKGHYLRQGLFLKFIFTVALIVLRWEWQNLCAQLQILRIRKGITTMSEHLESFTLEIQTCFAHNTTSCYGEQIAELYQNQSILKNKNNKLDTICSMNIHYSNFNRCLSICVPLTLPGQTWVLHIKHNAIRNNYLLWSFIQINPWILKSWTGHETGTYSTNGLTVVQTRSFTGRELINVHLSNLYRNLFIWNDLFEQLA